MSKQFKGYVYINPHTICFEDSKPQERELWNLFASYEENCGVFFATVEVDGATVYFTDPIGQHPVFYRIVDGDIVGVDSEIWNLGATSLNAGVFFDYYWYQSPLIRQTVFDGVYRLGPDEYLVCTNMHEGLGAGRFETRTHTTRFDRFLSYEDGLKVCAERARDRADALDNADINLQLRGGLDSRLALAMIMSAGLKPRVFRLGGAGSSDRHVAEEIRLKYSLERGRMIWQGSPPYTSQGLFDAVLATCGMKSNNLTNYLTGPFWGKHYEVTGFFSEGLLKGFTNIYDLREKGVTLFDWGRRTSDFPGAYSTKVSQGVYMRLSRFSIP